VFTAVRASPYIQHITFRSLTFNGGYRYDTNNTNVLSSADTSYTCWTHLVYHTNYHPFGDTLNARLNSKYINSEWISINTPQHTQKMTAISGLPQSSGWLITDCIQQLDRYTMIRPHAVADSLSARARGAAPDRQPGSHDPNITSCADIGACFSAQLLRFN
jgi:hypothetical protein